MILDGFVPYFYITAKLLVTSASTTALWAISTNVLKMLSKMVYSHNKFTNFFQFHRKKLTFFNNMASCLLLVRQQSRKCHLT